VKKRKKNSVPWRLVLLPLLGLGLTDLPALSQERTQILDVVVTDPSGRAVSNLTAADFAISLDGRPQQIVGSSYVDWSGPPAPPDQSIRLQGSRRNDDRRIVFLVDDLNLSVESATAVRQLLRRYVERQMQPRDEASVVRTFSGAGTDQRFTSDRQALAAIVDRIQPQPFTPPAASHSLFSVGTIGILQLALDGLRAVPGRKSVILFTEAHSVRSTALDSLIEKADRGFAVFYAIDPRGIDTTFEAPAPPAQTPPPLGRHVEPLLATVPSERPASLLEELAKATGGLALDRGGVASQFARVLEDQEGYYQIQYHRDFAIFQPETGARLVDHVTVKVARGGLHTRARDGFPPSSDWLLDVLPTTLERLLQATRLPFTAGDIHLAVDTGFYHVRKEGPLLNLQLQVDARDLTFLKTLDGRYNYGLTAGVTLLGDDGALVSAVRSELGGAPMTGDQHQEAIQHRTSFVIRVPVPRPGAYQVRVALSDQMSQRLGSANQFVYVPDVASGQLTLSAITLSTGSTPRDPLAITYQIYNLAHGPDNRSEMDLRIRILRNSKEVTTAGPSLIQFEPSDDPAHRSVTSLIRLDSALHPGSYQLQLTVTDKLAKSRRTTLAEIPLEIH